MAEETIVTIVITELVSLISTLANHFQVDSHEHGIYYVNHITKTAQFHHPSSLGTTDSTFTYPGQSDSTNNPEADSGTTKYQTGSLLSPTQSNPG